METDGALNDRIKRYQKYLEKCQTVDDTNEDNLLTVLKKLNNLPVTLDHLQETGIGKTVNGYRKHQNEAIGQLARSLVSKWKQLVEIVTAAAAYNNSEDNECVEPEADESPANSASSAGSSPVVVEHLSPMVNSSSRHSQERKINDIDNIVRSKISPSHSSRKDEFKSTSKQSCDNSPSPHKPDKQASLSHSSGVKLNSKISESRPELRTSDSRYTSSKPSSSCSVTSSGRESFANEVSIPTSGKNRERNSHVSKSEQPSTANNGAHRSSSSSGRSSERVSEHQSGHSRNDDRVRQGHREASDKHQRQQVPNERISKSESNSGPSRTAHSSSPVAGKSEIRSDRTNDSERHKKSSDAGKDLQRKHGSSSSSHSSHHSAEKSHHSSKGKTSTDVSAASHKDSPRDVAKTLVKGSSSERSTKDGRSGTETNVHNSEKKDRSLKEEVAKDTTRSKEHSGRQCVKDDDQFTKLRSLTPDPREVKSKSVGFASLEPESYFDDPTSDADVDNVADDNFGGLSFEELLNYDNSSSKAKKKSSGPTKTNKSTVDGRSSYSNSSSSKSAAVRSADLSSDEAQKPKTLPRSTHDTHDSKKMSLSSVPVIPKPLEKVEISADDICGSVDDIVAVYNPQSLQKLEADEDDGAWLGNKKQNMRTSVYSGKKVQYLKEVPTLFQACMRVLMDNVDALEYVGQVPYEIMKPVFECCSPQQLYTIEDLNPQFVGETDELWEKHCKREFRNADPSEFESWRELYLRLFDEREERLRNVTASISRSHAEKIAPMKQAKLAYINTTVKPPRDVRRNQLKNHIAVPSKSVSPLDRKRHAATIAASAPSAPSPPPFKRLSTGASSSSPSPADTRQSNKPAVKLVAPMMAKTLRQMKGWRR